MQIENAQFAPEGTNSNIFPKAERLCSKKLIAQLFAGGSAFNLYPLRFVVLKAETPSEEFPQVLISVSKKYFKRAVDRNRLKRQMREAYRLNKYKIMSGNGQLVSVLGIIYIGKEKVPYNLIEKKLNLGLERLVKE
ncbi:MAG TPA: ribonuclease P protein component [Adhaeribacter sp.]|nr:ribonuclease P protein component [Adhaeribacter sp.]